MSRDPQTLIFIGIKNSVIALDDRTGDEVWRSDLVGSDFVSVLWDGQAVFAANSGEVFKLDPKTGDLLWQNELKGFGRGLVSLASSRIAGNAGAIDAVAAKRQYDQQAAAASAAAAG